MIAKEDIKNKDFSFELSAAIGKLGMVYNTLELLYDKDAPDEDGIYELTIDAVLKEVIKDLKTINHELYNSKTPPEPDTAPMSADKG